MLHWSQRCVCLLSGYRLWFPSRYEISDLLTTMLWKYVHNIAVRRSEQFVHWPSILWKFHIWRETTSGSQINDKHTVDSSLTFDITTAHSAHLQLLVLPQHCCMKVRAVRSLAYCFTITSTKCRKNTVVSPDDGHIGTQNLEIYKYTKRKR